MDFEGKTIWITGASSGIGKAMAIELSGQKTHLILSGRDKLALEDTARNCSKNGVTPTLLPFDLNNEKSIKSATDFISANNIKVDALYQFGGISQRSFADETPISVDRKIFEVNYFGTIALAKFVLPLMIKNGGGQLAVTSSIVGKFGFPYRSSYSASKQALHGFFESLRAENTAKNIKVSIIIPGRIKTNISVNAIDKNGEAHAQMDEGQNNGMTAKKCAKIICKKLKKERKEIMVGGKEMIMVHIRRLLPRLYYYLASRVKPL